ncbi:Cell division protein FtsI/penicillin-binding protein 2 [Bhargavaea ginsengi]|uniref:Cell division protein FtsI/penicillin-binding protein 2 n=1 Tax=Bhargavaea ginsengi TaxID=426757 RepID=A0A1H6X2X2_9BACL|nr:penicillin-binding protein 2 [Bhargavaea ginsengi]SEJ20917.1 Cell division protein FtsI/penicillin-binding protein 2 [Bhargavaea ginsengi]
MNRRRRSSKQETPKQKLRKNTTFRMNVLFFTIFLLFSSLVLRLGYLQIVKGEDYKRVIERTEEISVNTSVPRGRIYDRTGQILVGNEPKRAITYTKKQSTKTDEMLEVARGLSALIEKDPEDVTQRDKKDFWILLNKDEAYDRVSDKEKKAINSDETKSKTERQRELDSLVRDKITEADLEAMSPEEVEVLAIYREMTSGYNYSPQIIKSGDVTPEEYARVSERLHELPGVNTTTDWERVRNSELAILGQTTTPKEGLPGDDLQYYLARGYSRNDRVGKSFIEKQYESVLQGQKTIAKNITDKAGNVLETVPVQEGQPGKDLVLSIDSELQKKAEEVVSRHVLSIKNGRNSQMFDRIFFVMMDPNNGEILSMVGKQAIRNKETGKYEVYDRTFGTYQDAYEAGSTIKMATILAGYQHGGATVGQTMIDAPMHFRGTPPKRSLFNWYNSIPVNDITAITRSSNVYMWKIAIGIGGGSYVPNGPLSIDSQAIDRFRHSFASFGLGVETGIDLPDEAAGQHPSNPSSSNVLDFAIGQYDTYTTMQLAQYVSTIANGGYRVAPRVVKEIREPSPDGKKLGPIATELPAKYLNRVSNSDNQIERMKQGMYTVYYDRRGTAYSTFSDTEGYKAAGKTGTAERRYYEADRKDPWFGKPTVNVSHVGFAPYEDPEIAYAVLAPNVSSNTNSIPHPNNEIAREMTDFYFELKEQRIKSGEAGANIEGALKESEDGTVIREGEGE